jgi:hypothetical protein
MATCPPAWTCTHMHVHCANAQHIHTHATIPRFMYIHMHKNGHTQTRVAPWLHSTGDSGGPLTFNVGSPADPLAGDPSNDRLVGITSFGWARLVAGAACWKLLVGRVGSSDSGLLKRKRNFRSVGGPRTCCFGRISAAGCEAVLMPSVRTYPAPRTRALSNDGTT